MSPQNPYEGMSWNDVRSYQESVSAQIEYQKRQYEFQQLYRQLDNPNYYARPNGIRDGSLSRYSHTEPDVAEKPFEKIEDLSKRRKDEILKVLEIEYLSYRLQIKITNMTTGLKWFLIFLGFAIMANFDKILNLVAVIVRH